MKAVDVVSRTEGFEVMDVSTSLPNDPKFRRLAREYPADLTVAFFAYVATMAESWKAGERVTVDVAWPAILPRSDSAVTALYAVKLLDPKGRVTVSAWRGYFEQARDRREKSRERWRRANSGRAHKPDEMNGKDSADTSRLPRGDRAVTAPPSDSVRPSDSESVSSLSLSESHHPARDTESDEVAHTPTTDRSGKRDATEPAVAAWLSEDRRR